MAGSIVDKPRSGTLRAALHAVRPRPTLYAALGLQSSRAGEIIAGGDPGTTERLARIGGRILLSQSRGSPRRAAMKVWQILTELHPEAFRGDSDHDRTVSADASQRQPRDHAAPVSDSEAA